MTVLTELTSSRQTLITVMLSQRSPVSASTTTKEVSCTSTSGGEWGPVRATAKLSVPAMNGCLMTVVLPSDVRYLVMSRGSTTSTVRCLSMLSSSLRTHSQSVFAATGFRLYGCASKIAAN